VSLEESSRDDRGRWRCGVSGNPAGRRKGSRNRWRRADPERAAIWTPGEWRLHYHREVCSAQGDPGERAAAGFAACMNLWRLMHPARAKLGICPQCGRLLALPNLPLNGAPIPFDGVFVHYGCLRDFALARWQEATTALAVFGICV